METPAGASQPLLRIHTFPFPPLFIKLRASPVLTQRRREREGRTHVDDGDEPVQLEHACETEMVSSRRKRVRRGRGKTDVPGTCHHLLPLRALGIERNSSRFDMLREDDRRIEG